MLQEIAHSLQKQVSGNDFGGNSSSQDQGHSSCLCLVFFMAMEEADSHCQVKQRLENILGQEIKKYGMRNESGTETRTPSTCPGQHLLSLLSDGTHMAFRFCG